MRPDLCDLLRPPPPPTSHRTDKMEEARLLGGSEGLPSGFLIMLILLFSICPLWSQ